MMMTMQIIIIKLNQKPSPVGICKLDFIIHHSNAMMDVRENASTNVEAENYCDEKKYTRKIMSREHHALRLYKIIFDYFYYVIFDI